MNGVLNNLPVQEQAIIIVLIWALFFGVTTLISGAIITLLSYLLFAYTLLWIISLGNTLGEMIDTSKPVRVLKRTLKRWFRTTVKMGNIRRLHNVI